MPADEGICFDGYATTSHSSTSCFVARDKAIIKRMDRKSELFGGEIMVLSSPAKQRDTFCREAGKRNRWTFLVLMIGRQTKASSSEAED